jgi:hypothetical protein
MIDAERERDFLSLPSWGRTKMTVGIAAICRKGSDPAIVACADWKISSDLGSAETRWKLAHVGYWDCLGAGLDSDIIALRQRVDYEFKKADTLDETTLVPLCSEAVRKRKHERANMAQG